MRRWKQAVDWQLSGFLMLIMGVGCATSIKNPSTDAAKTRRSVAAGTQVAASSASAVRLTVNEESVGVKELWNGSRDELRRQANHLTPSEYQDYVVRRAAVLIRDRIAGMLLYQRAKLRLPPDAQGRIDGFVDGEIRKIVTTEYEGRQARYAKKLESEGRTLDEVREQLRREVVITSYLEAEVKPKVSEPTRAEMWQVFQAAADSLRRMPRRRMSLIDVRTRNRLPAGVSAPTPEQLETARTEARSRAETALAEVHDGVAFAEVAQRYSDGLHAAEGGSWGWIAPGSVRERFEPVVHAAELMPAGSVSEIIGADDDFLIVRCDEIDPGYEPDFQAEQPRLRNEIIRNDYNRRIEDLVEELRSKARIEPTNLEQLHAAVVAAAPTRTELVPP